MSGKGEVNVGAGDFCYPLAVPFVAEVWRDSDSDSSAVSTAHPVTRPSAAVSSCGFCWCLHGFLLIVVGSASIFYLFICMFKSFIRSLRCVQCRFSVVSVFAWYWCYIATLDATHLHRAQLHDWRHICTKYMLHVLKSNRDEDHQAARDLMSVTFEDACSRIMSVPEPWLPGANHMVGITVILLIIGTPWSCSCRSWFEAYTYGVE